MNLKIDNNSSVYEFLFKFLKENNFEVFTPGTKTGQCLNDYLVILKGKSAQINAFSSIDDFYTLLCYVPSNKYSSIEKFIIDVKSIMKNLFPMLIDTLEQTEPFYDSEIKAWMVSLLYKNHKKL